MAQLLDDGSNVLNIGNDSRVYLAENKDNVLGFVARYFAYDNVSSVAPTLRPTSPSFISKAMPLRRRNS
ncbi:hypothetical protein M8494_00300 [Serratia ureilytica]